MSSVQKWNYVSKFNRQFSLKHIFLFNNLSCSSANFLKKVNLLQIWIFKEFDQFYTKVVNIKISVINKYILVVKHLYYQKSPELVHFIDRFIDT